MQPMTAPPRSAPPRSAAPLRRDPAPSRAAYRMQRLWLTPLFRALMRVGVPAFVLALSVGLYLADDARRNALAQSWTAMRDTVEQRPEFMVTLMAVDGASPSLADAIRSVAAVKLPQSSFDIDLDATQARIAALDAVAAAEVRVKTGGVLQVTITERQPALVWRKADSLDLLDAGGRRVAQVLKRSDRSDLPLIAGEGAGPAAPEALAIFAAAGPLMPRVRGLVRMGERRWDLVLDRDQRILLPSEEPVRALERIIALDQAEELLKRNILTVDLRNRTRPTLRLAPKALHEMRRAQGIETEVESSL